MFVILVRLRTLPRAWVCKETETVKLNRKYFCDIPLVSNFGNVFNNRSVQSKKCPSHCPLFLPGVCATGSKRQFYLDLEFPFPQSYTQYRRTESTDSKLW